MSTITSGVTTTPAYSKPTLRKYTNFICHVSMVFQLRDLGKSLGESFTGFSVKKRILGINDGAVQVGLG